MNKINNTDFKRSSKSLLLKHFKNNGPRLAHHSEKNIRLFTQIISGQSLLAHNYKTKLEWILV